MLQIANAAMNHLETFGRGRAAESARSISAVRSPRNAASRAAAAPNEPPPMMSRSNSPSINA